MPQVAGSQEDDEKDEEEDGVVVFMAVVVRVLDSRRVRSSIAEHIMASAAT